MPFRDGPHRLSLVARLRGWLELKRHGRTGSVVPLGGDRLDVRTRGPPAQVFQKKLQLRRNTLRHDFDRPVWTIAYPAGQA